MAETNGQSPQQTSVFIAQPQQGDHKVSDNLLSPSASTKTPRNFANRKCSRKACLILGLVMVVLLVVAIVVILVTLLPAAPNNTTEAPQDRLASFCPGTNTSAYSIIGLTHGLDHRCSSTVNVTQACSDPNQATWKLFDGQTADGKRALKLTMINGMVYKSVLVSPMYWLRKPSCTLHFSYNFGGSNSDAYLITSHNSTRLNTMTSSGCTYGKDLTIGAERTSFRIVVVTNSTVTPGAARFTMTSHVCASFESIALEPKKTSQPEFAKIKLYEPSVCSLEIINQTAVGCSWWNVQGIDNGDFRRMDTHACVEAGVGVKSGASHFISFEPTAVTSRAILVSPIMESGADHVIFSFWYLFQCENLELRAYAVPVTGDNVTGSGDVIGSVDVSKMVLDLRNLKPVRKWTHIITNLRPSKKYKGFQVVIEAIGTSTPNCSQHYCNNANNVNNQQPTVPLVALDDLTLESVRENCNVAGLQNLVDLDCRFQHSNGTPTMCLWDTLKPDFMPPKVPPFFEFEWQPVSSAENDMSDHGPVSRHFEGRGHVLLFDATGRQEGRFWSPLLVSNQSCSCNLTMLYLLRGNRSPRLTINFVLGNVVHGLDGPAQNLPRQLKWSTHGHQSDNWINETVVLNLEAGVVFTLEFFVEKPGDGTADAAVDDILFHGCDLSIVNTTTTPAPTG